ncbi:hypothetical protein LRP49_15735 [Enterovibrio sp. ZSDZ35]|uniref:Transposase n=1 Tax=Enterovibrio qingdaonensis TaxID=2899818 RepID=A0ABT5QPU7_9GAMM|nr:hypothetical protein [Enterovibrio sp. ZSDZ35]MDD1782624.1 hypothetical protein [Enterovibrio sp. ZSDZ35]
MLFRREYNGCKTFSCVNCGNPDPALYSRSSRLGYAAWHCPECGAYPPELSNPPILALAEQIAQTRIPDVSPLIWCCAQPLFVKYGLTRSGSPRVQCIHCRKVHTLANPNTLSKQLQPLLDGLLAGISPVDLAAELTLSNKVFSERMAKLTCLLSTVMTRVEISALSQKVSPIVQTRSHVQVCRSGLSRAANKQAETHVWTLTSVDARTGYVYLISDNVLLSADNASCLEAGHYVPRVKEQGIDSEANVLSRAEKTYAKIMARTQFDELAYCHEKHGQIAKGALLRPVYAAHAHMQILYQQLANTSSVYLLLEHESFVRGAAITAFDTRVKNVTANLYYWHVAADIDADRVSEPQQKTLSWWNEKWFRTNSEREGQHYQIALGYLTPRVSQPPKNADSLFPSELDWNAVFWQDFDHWLPPSHAAKLSMERVRQWQTVYRYLHNIVWSKKPRLPIYKTMKPISVESLVALENTLSVALVADISSGSEK